ncbi:hypothetical protein ACFVFI_34480 [Streptomyces sp. NPDC057705]|uniref:hypothetical protein n=1 Tax=Streptomyces sp. NPDC057705 TaxID=3346222 RepID=UPI0036B38A98
MPLPEAATKGRTNLAGQVRGGGEDLPERALQSSGTVPVRAVGAEEGIAVVNLTGGGEAVSYGIDTASHSLRWTQPGLEAVPAGAGMAVDAGTGKLLWALKDGEGDRKPPAVTAVWHGRVYGRGVGGPVVLDVRTGADMPTKPEAAPLLVNSFAGLVLNDNRPSSHPAGG